MARIILSTGGTGGHIFPALATGEALLELLPDVELLFMGCTYGPEARMARDAGIPFLGLPGRGILGRGLSALPAMWSNSRAILMGLKELRLFKPCAVAAFGGYACFAPSIAAKILGIPLLLHEQNAIVGTSIKLLSRLANAICVSLPQTAGIHKPFIMTGNPVRKQITKSQARTGRNQKHMLVLGGSQGAHSINEAIYAILPDLARMGVNILHQTGEKDIETARKKYIEAGFAPDCAQAFIDDMSGAYGWADFAVCRAGASTIAELCIAELPAILIPFPAAIHDHQTINAKMLVEAGAAIFCPESQLASLKGSIKKLVGNPNLVSQMSRACGNLARPEAAFLVAQEIIKLCGIKTTA